MDKWKVTMNPKLDRQTVQWFWFSLFKPLDACLLCFYTMLKIGTARIIYAKI